MNTFVDCLQFTIIHQDLNTAHPYCVIVKDDLKIMVFQDKILAGEHHPELRIETKNIAAAYDKILATHPNLLHPNLNKITLRPWGAKEFAIADCQLGIRFQEW